MIISGGSDGGQNIAIDSFELQQDADGKKIIYVRRTADSNSGQIYKQIDKQDQQIKICSGSQTFVITKAVISNYQFSTDAEEDAKEYFQIRGSGISLESSSS